MKILYITNYQEIERDSGGFIDDYLSDLLFFGLKELLGENVIDSTQIPHMYIENKTKIPIQKLWCKGFTSTFLLEKDDSYRSHIADRIKDKEFDFIIYGAVQRCLDYYDLVSKTYDPKKIIMVDGHDRIALHPLFEKHTYFKRELTFDHPNLHPISFAMPTHKVVRELNDKKTKKIGTVIPGKMETYIYKEEGPYYKDYQNSYFGITCKKAGWDAMRHYEILANGCMPYFEGIKNCPKNILTTLPKDMILEGNSLYHNFNEKKYFSLLEQMFKYNKTHLTTRALAEKFLKTIE